MSKLVFLKIGEGSFQAGFPVTLRMGEEGYQSTIEVTGYLPPALRLLESYQRWQVSYYRLGSGYRLEAKAGYVTNVSITDDCNDLAGEFRDRLNQWLQTDSFRPIREKLLEQLSLSETIRVVLQTNVPELRRFPWHLWNFFERYARAEVALGAPSFEPAAQAIAPRNTIRVLAVLGHAQGLDLEQDKALLNQLPHANVHLLVEPSHQELNEALWHTDGWDILFFAGHSSSQPASSSTSLLDMETEAGCIAINPAERLSIAQLKYALKKSQQRGLSIAIFNSCDGLGLAQDLADLQIPQILVMREPIPDQVAHSFLKAFLAAFARGETFYLAVREARERLQGLERQFPCATWLPVICQNPAEIPPTWQTLYQRRSPNSTTKALPNQKRLAINLLTCAGVATVLLVARLLGVFQAWELKAYDYLLALRPLERPDRRIVVIATGIEDVESSITLSNPVLNRLLTALESYEPRLIGLDLYRDFSASPDHHELTTRLGTAENLVSICKSSDAPIGVQGIRPSPDIPESQIGFSDFLTDSDRVLRRHLLVMTPEIDSPCQASYAFSTQLALRYLAAEGYADEIWTNDGRLKLGKTVFEPITPRFGSYQSVDAEGYQLLLNYRQLSSHRQIAETVPLEKVLSQELSVDALKDKIVLIGRTDHDSRDLWLTPDSHPQQIESLVPGVMVHAQMISHILSAAMDDRPLLRTWPEWGEMGWIILWGFVGGGVAILHDLTSSRPPAARLVLGLMAAEASLWTVSWVLLVQNGLWVPVIPPAVAIATTLIIVELYPRRQARHSSDELTGGDP